MTVGMIPLSPYLTVKAKDLILIPTFILIITPFLVVPRRRIYYVCTATSPGDTWL